MTNPTSGPTADTSTPPTGPDQHLIEELRHQIADLERERDRWHDEVQRTSVQLEHEQESVRGLVVALTREQHRAELAEGHIDELLAISKVAWSARNEPEAIQEPPPMESPIEGTPDHAGPLWRSWAWWKRRHP